MVLTSPFKIWGSFDISSAVKGIEPLVPTRLQHMHPRLRYVRNLLFLLSPVPQWRTFWSFNPEGISYSLYSWLNRLYSIRSWCTRWELHSH